MSHINISSFTGLNWGLCSLSVAMVNCSIRAPLMIAFSHSPRTHLTPWHRSLIFHHFHLLCSNLPYHLHLSKNRNKTTRKYWSIRNLLQEFTQIIKSPLSKQVVNRNTEKSVEKTTIMTTNNNEQQQVNNDPTNSNHQLKSNQQLTFNKNYTQPIYRQPTM